MTWIRIKDQPPVFPCFSGYWEEDKFWVTVHRQMESIERGTHWTPFTPPEPEKSECEVTAEKWFSTADLNARNFSVAIRHVWNVAWSAASERAAKIVDTEYWINKIDRDQIASKIREQ